MRPIRTNPVLCRREHYSMHPCTARRLIIFPRIWQYGSPSTPSQKCRWHLSRPWTSGLSDARAYSRSSNCLFLVRLLGIPDFLTLVALYLAPRAVVRSAVGSDTNRRSFKCLSSCPPLHSSAIAFKLKRVLHAATRFANGRQSGGNVPRSIHPSIR